MKTTCPACKGERQFYRIKDLPPPTISETATTSIMETTFERELVVCEVCAGSGRVERTERVPVIQDGVVIGSVPATFNPSKIKSWTFWYRPREGDFVQRGETFVVAPGLGPGDFEAVHGFTWERV